MSATGSIVDKDTRGFDHDQHSDACHPVMNRPYWEHFEHQADIGIRGHGATLEEALIQAAIALTAIITDPATVKPVIAVDIHCHDEDPDYLLLDWLNALVYEMAVRRMLFSRYEVRVRDGQLTGRAWGEPVDIPRHQPAVEVKGATLTELAVTHIDGRWTAQCVVDV